MYVRKKHNHTKNIFGCKIGLMLYGVTTLYLETARTDVLQ